MSQLLFEHIVVDVRWETLLGLENEKKEIRQLAAENQAQHYLVIDNGLQTRSVGLTTIALTTRMAKDGKHLADDKKISETINQTTSQTIEQIATTAASDENQQLVSGQINDETNGKKWFKKKTAAKLTFENAAASNTAKQSHYSLAALFCFYSQSTEKLFLHRLPNDDKQAIVIAIRDHRPVIDQVLPWLEAYKVAQLFFESCQSKLEIFGEAWPNPDLYKCQGKAPIKPAFVIAQSQIKPLALALLIDTKNNLADREKICIFQAIKDKNTVSIRKLGYVSTFCLGSCLLLYGVYRGYVWLTAPPPVQPPPPPNPATIFKREQQAALDQEALYAGLDYAQRLYRALTPLPVNARGWHPTKIICEKQSCILNWERGNGGTYNSVLALRNNAVVESINGAKEIIEFKPQARHLLDESNSEISTNSSASNETKTATQTDSNIDKTAAINDAGNLSTNAETNAETSVAVDQGTHNRSRDSVNNPINKLDNNQLPLEVTPIPAEQFYRSAGARLQTLKDFQMDVTIELPQPLIPFPADLENQKQVIKPISKGAWKLQGKLAFLDSVSGLLARAPNVSLERLEITVDPKNPIFNAQGSFYVE